MMNIVLKDENLNLLTERELEVLQYKCGGYSEKQIAEQLVIEPRTVKNHLAHIYTKLEIDTFSRSQRAILISQFRPYVADALDRKRKQKLDKQKAPVSEEIEKTAIVLAGGAVQSEWDTTNLSPTAIIAVLEDELYLTQQSLSSLQIISSPTIEIPEADVRYSNISRKKGDQLPMALLGFALVAGIILGGGFTSVWFNQRGENQRKNIVPTSIFNEKNTFVPKPISTSIITASIAATFSQISYCGEIRGIPSSPSGNFLRSQGVSAFTVENTTKSVINNFVRSLTIDPRGVWIGYFATKANSASGVGLYTKQAWVNCNSSSGITNQNINTIKIDKTDRIWVATEQAGVSVFDGRQWHTYTTQDGLPSNTTL